MEYQPAIPSAELSVHLFPLHLKGVCEMLTSEGHGTADGTCAIEVIEPTFGFSDQASGYEIVRAAWAVITSCVGDNKREGGIAEKIGTLYSSIPPMIAMFQPSVAI